MKIRARINGEERLLELLEPAGGLRIDGREFEAEAVEVQPGAYSILAGARSLQVFLEELGQGRYQATVEGRRYELALEDARRRLRGRADRGARGPRSVAAPMPGRVVRVLVEPGQAVSAGQGLLVVEAMKMQNEIKAPEAGTVLKLTVEAGGSVAAGQTMLVLE